MLRNFWHMNRRIQRNPQRVKNFTKLGITNVVYTILCFSWHRRQIFSRLQVHDCLLLFPLYFCSPSNGMILLQILPWVRLLFYCFQSRKYFCVSQACYSCCLSRCRRLDIPATYTLKLFPYDDHVHEQRGGFLTTPHTHTHTGQKYSSFFLRNFFMEVVNQILYRNQLRKINLLVHNFQEGT